MRHFTSFIVSGAFSFLVMAFVLTSVMATPVLQGSALAAEAETVQPCPGLEGPEGAAPTDPAASSEDAVLYGDHPLSWWKTELEEGSDEVEALEGELAEKKLFIDVYERGYMLRTYYLMLKQGRNVAAARRALEYGEVYTPEQVGLYNSYKRDVEGAEEGLRALEKKLKELKRKARYHGVPKKLRK